MKIGSAGDLKARISVYQTSSPFRDFELVGAVFVEDRIASEKKVIEGLGGLRVGRTEWFQIHHLDARLLLKSLTILEN